TALAARKSGLEMNEAIAVGLPDRKHLVVACNQPDFDIAARVGARKRMDKDIDAVVRGVGGETKIGNDEPLRPLLPVVTGNYIFRLGRHCVYAWAKILDRLVKREGGRHLHVELGLDYKFTTPDFDAAFIAEPLGLVTAHVALKLISKKSFDEIAIADPVNGQRYSFSVDAQN